MKQRILGGGAIVCSAMVMYGWAQSSTSNFNLGNCVGEFAKKLSGRSQAENQAQERCVPITLPKLSQVPEQLSIPSLSRASKVPPAMESMYAELLAQAHASADADRIAEAITIVAGIPKNSQHHGVAQQLQEDWSQELLERATNRYQQADMPMAMTMLNAIPQTSQRYDRATELRDRWQQQTTALDQALAAKDIGDWTSVIAALGTLEGTDLYHSALVQQLLQQATQKQFEPDAALMQLAATAATASSQEIPLSIPSTIPSTVSIDPVPQPTNLVVALDQALEWARPTPVSPSVPSKAPKREAMVNTTHSAIDSLTKGLLQ
jgi:hypothetical protein